MIDFLAGRNKRQLWTELANFVPASRFGNSGIRRKQPGKGADLASLTESKGRERRRTPLPLNLLTH